MNRLANSKNEFQGSFKKVLCVCSAGLLRSPTAALVLSQPPFGFNTRAAGISDDFALIVVDQILVHWADEIVCMTKDQAELLKRVTEKPIVCLNIEDSFAYRDPELIKRVADAYQNGEPM